MATDPNNDLYIRRDVIVDIDFGKRRDDVWALVYLLSDPFLNVQLISLSGTHGKEDIEALYRLLSFLGRENIPISLGNIEESRPSAMSDFLKETEEKDFSATFFSSSIEAYSEILPRLNKPIVLALGAFDSLAIVRPFLKKYHANIVLFGGMLNRELPINPQYRISDIPAARSLINDPELDVSILSFDSCARLCFNEKDSQNIKSSNTRLAIVLQENEAAYPFAKASDPLPALAAAWYLRYPVNFDIVVENVELSEDGYLLNQGGARPIPIIKSHHKEGYMKSVFLNAILADDGIKSDIQIIKGDRCTMVYPAFHPSTHLSVYETGWEKHRAEDRVGPLSRDLYIIHFLIDGNCRYQTSSSIKILGKGDCFLIPANEITTLDFHFENPAEYYWVAFHGSEASGIVAQCGFNRENGFALHAQDAASVLEIMKALVMVKSRGTGT
ncbi:MAG: AraC family ligand binding domain-containing protein, partial [Bacilli bacterium]|nr:AraC family ligand binding domain-containing protein [Bacilli bacterium]